MATTSNSIIGRYLIREIATPFLAVTVALTFIFASYSSARYLADAAQGQLAIGTVGNMVALKVLIALEVLIPIGLYLGIIFGLGRLYRDQEMIAMQAGGFTRSLVFRPMLRFSLVIALLVAGISWLARPWAYGEVYALEAAYEANVDLSRIEPGRFETAADGRVTLFAQSVKPPAELLDVFVATQDDAGQRVVLRAERMRQATTTTVRTTMVFDQGRLYRFGSDGYRDLLVRFEQLEWHFPSPQALVGYERKAASTSTLLAATGAAEIAERQWRLSRPAATLILALLGIALSRSAPRRGRFANTFAAVVAFALYYNLSGIARTWVEHGTVPTFPGIYWADALIAALAIGILFRPRVTHY